MKVYVITEGDYSDYHIIGVAETKEKAKRICKMFEDEYDLPNIEEYDTDYWIQTNQQAYQVKMDIKGHITSTRLNELGEFNQVYEIKDWLTGKEYGYEIMVRAKDEKHAFKIAQDKIAEFKARKEGI